MWFQFREKKKKKKKKKVRSFGTGRKKGSKKLKEKMISSKQQKATARVNGEEKMRG